MILPNTRCCLCGNPLISKGNDPWPLKPKVWYNSKVCCNSCNYAVVIPARLNKQNEVNNESKN